MSFNNAKISPSITQRPPFLSRCYSERRGGKGGGGVRMSGKGDVRKVGEVGDGAIIKEYWTIYQNFSFLSSSKVYHILIFACNLFHIEHMATVDHLKIIHYYNM